MTQPAPPKISKDTTIGELERHLQEWFQHVMLGTYTDRRYKSGWCNFDHEVWSATVDADLRVPFAEPTSRACDLHRPLYAHARTGFHSRGSYVTRDMAEMLTELFAEAARMGAKPMPLHGQREEEEGEP